MPHPFERHTVSFVVRLWVEPLQTGQMHWRGQIEHVGSGQKTHFQVPAALLDFVRLNLPNLIPPDPPTIGSPDPSHPPNPIHSDD
jgi:hypothetical protein